MSNKNDNIENCHYYMGDYYYNNNNIMNNITAATDNMHENMNYINYLNYNNSDIKVFDSHNMENMNS